jgi:hypothetical protein
MIMKTCGEECACFVTWKTCLVSNNVGGIHTCNYLILVSMCARVRIVFGVCVCVSVALLFLVGITYAPKNHSALNFFPIKKNTISDNCLKR